MTATAPPNESRELSPDERKEREEVCFEIEQAIKDAIRNGREALWSLAHALYEFDEQHGWTALGYETQAEWLAQPEVGLTRSAYFRLVRRHRELVVHRQIPMKTLAALEPSKVDIVMGAIADQRVQVKEALNDAEALGARDLREKYIGIQSAPQRAEDAPEGGAADDHDDLDDGDDPEVIEGEAKTITTDDEPTTAAEVMTQNGAKTTPKAKEAEALFHSAGVVDSWLAVGGDRRKAKRNLQKLRDHPLFIAFNLVTSYVEADESAPDKDEALEAWAIVVEAFGYELDVS